MTFWRCHYHLIRATRNRLPVIDSDREAVIARCLASVADEKAMIMHGFGIVEDHVHVVLSIPPKWSVAEIVKALKGSSSNQLGATRAGLETDWPGWQGEYGALTFGDSSFERIVEYVRNQKAHHAANTTWAALERVERKRDQSSHADSSTVTD